MGWLRSSLQAWRYAVRTFVALYSLLSLLLAGAYLVPFEQVLSNLAPTSIALLIFWYRIFIWALIALVVLLYTPGKLIEEYKRKTREQFYRMDAEPNIDRAYRVFDKLYRRGQMLRKGTTELRQEWDERVRAALIEHCNNECLDIYLSNTGRIDPRSGLQLLADEKYEDALQHIEWILRRDFERDIKWPR